MNNEIASNSELVGEPILESRAPIAIAGFWRRILALLIDSMILGVVGIVFGFMFFDTLAALGVWGRLFGFSIALLYFGFLNSRIGNGQTVGKRILKIQVVGRDGQLISVSRSCLRYSVLGPAYFLNGAMIPPSILMTPIEAVVSLLIFGFGGATIYLYLFNRKTRQSLHDLVARTYVVRSRLSSELNLSPMATRHLYITGVILLLSIILPLVTTRLVTSTAPFADLLKVQNSLLDSGKLQMASVFVGQGAGPNGNVNYFRADAVWKGEPGSMAEAQREIASIVLRDYPDAVNKDLIVIAIAYGYDIGIASYWRSASDEASPKEWIARLKRLT
ncbi:MAG: RDD family protein [Acidobacteriota bacterium]